MANFLSLKQLTSSVPLSKCAALQHNNIRIMRHLAASLVIFSHAYSLNLGQSGSASEPFHQLIGVAGAEIAVNIFFVLSGYLVTRSLLTHKDIIDYVFSRALRIYPALIVVVLLTVFVLGPLTTTLPVSTYFNTRLTYDYLIYSSMVLSPIYMVYSLPGVFQDLPYPRIVNGSLWTLPWEISMYGILVVLFALRVLSRPLLWAPPVIFLHFLVQLNIVELSIYGDLLCRFLIFFLGGALLHCFAHRIPLSGIMAVAVSAFTFGPSLISDFHALAPFGVIYIVAFFAFYPRLILSSLSEGDDLSYGIYIYAYPIQQLLVLYLGPHAAWLNTVIALVLASAAAFASWHLIEKPSLALKITIRRWRANLAPALLCLRDRN